MIWYLLKTDVLTGRTDAAYAGVSAARRASADAYRNEAGRLGQLAAGLLERFVLGGAADTRRTNAYGKPLLADGRCYSLSHTAGAVVLCVDTVCVGIDVETVRVCDERVVRRCFLPEEQAYILEAADRDAAFTAVFTRKEAVVKAVGKGLALPLTAFSVLPMADVCITAEDTALYLHTERDGERTVSFASERPAEWVCRTLLWQDVWPTKEEKLRVLCRIGAQLNAASVTWAIGASLLLYFKGMTDVFHDLDLMIAPEDADRAKRVLEGLGSLQPPKPNAQYQSAAFYEFLVDDVDVDMMAGFRIVDGAKTYDFPLNRKSISERMVCNGVEIPLQSVAQWRECYRLMHRTDKVALIDKFAKA